MKKGVDVQLQLILSEIIMVNDILWERRLQMAEEGFLNEFCSTIRNELDKEISEKILEGSEEQDEREMNRLAAWFSGVVERMDSQLSGIISAKIMKSMGYGCAIMHNEHIKANRGVISLKALMHILSMRRRIRIQVTLSAGTVTVCWSHTIRKQ